MRSAPIDGIQVSYRAYNIAIDHVSVHGSGDGNLDITDSTDVTVSWSILAGAQNMLVKYGPARGAAARRRRSAAPVGDHAPKLLTGHSTSSARQHSSRFASPSDAKHICGCVRG